MLPRKTNLFLQQCAMGIAIGMPLLWLACILPWGYDDAGHLLAVKALAKSGIWGFPKSPQEIVPNSLFVTAGLALHLPVAALIRLGIAPEIAGRFWIVLHGLVLVLAISSFRPKNRSAHLWTAAGFLTSVQFLSYGARYLGEVPGLAYLALTVLSLSQKNKTYWLSIPCGSLAVFSKEYFLLPLLGLVFFRLLFDSQNFKRDSFVALAWVFSLAGFYAYLFGNDLAAALNYWKEKFGYRSEFLIFSTESIRFLFFKPLLVAGTIALWLEYWVQRKPIIRDAALLQIILVLMFLASSGYDRFGLWLVPSAALGLAPWLRFLKNQLRSKSSLAKVVAWIVVLGFLSQRSLPILAHWSIVWAKNDYPTSKVNDFLRSSLAPKNILTCEAEIALALNGYHWQLPVYPPMAAHNQVFNLSVGDWFIAGPFSESFYNIRFNDSMAVPIAKFPVHAASFFRHPAPEFYTIYRITQAHAQICCAPPNNQSTPENDSSLPN